MNYRYREEIKNIPSNDIELILNNLELSLRSGKFNYNVNIPSTEQLRNFVSGWKKEYLDAMKEKSKELGIVGKIPTSAAKKIIFKVLDTVIAQGLSNNSSFIDNTGRFLVAEAALCLLFGIAPQNDINTGIININGKKIGIKTATRLGEIIIISENVDKADYYVYCLVNKELAKPTFIGWTTKDFVKTTPTGNRITDPNNCNWAKLSYHFDYKLLNPMSQFLTEFGINNVMSGILMEQIPDFNEIPNPHIINVQTIVGISAESAREKWLKQMGLTPKPPEKIPQEETHQNLNVATF